PELVRRFRANGAQLIVNLSNDAWFGPVGYPEMHLAHAVFRAIETGAWVVRGANTGISAAIDPRGRVRARPPACTEGSCVAALARRVRANVPQLVVNLSIDAWFGPVGYPAMHLAHAVFRAIETGAWVVRGANTGISAAIDPRGRVRARLPAFTEGSFVAEVAP